MLLIAILSAGTGAAAGYTISRSSHQSPAETIGLPIYHLAAAAPTSTTPAALEASQPDPAPLATSSPRYMLGTDHGFVTVFYIQNDHQELTLKERTRTPESALSPDERERLQSGIYIYTEEQLMRVLQDYDS